MFQPNRVKIVIDGVTVKVPHRIFDVLPTVEGNIYTTGVETDYKTVESLLSEMLTGFAGRFTDDCTWKYFIAFFYKYIPNKLTRNLSPTTVISYRDGFYEHIMNLVNDLNGVDAHKVIYDRNKPDGYYTEKSANIVNLIKDGVYLVEVLLNKPIIELLHEYIGDNKAECHVLGIYDGDGLWEM